MLPARPRGKVADDNKLGVVSHHKGIQVRRALPPPRPVPRDPPTPAATSDLFPFSLFPSRVSPLRQDKMGAGAVERGGRPC